MKSLLIKKSSLSGNITIPSSKSHTLRSLVFALMAKGTSHITNFLNSPDTFAMIRAIESLGAKVEKKQSSLQVTGTAGIISSSSTIVDAGNSGQVLRFIGALAPLAETYTIITGDHSIRESRPVKPLLDGLLQLGAFATSTRLNNKAPIIVRGPLKPGVATIDGEDSQPVSALLIAASFLKGKTELHVTNSGEKPWIDLTLYWMDRLGIGYSHKNYEHYIVQGNACYDGFEISIPGDFSSAAYPIAAALVTNSELTLENIDMNDVQGDKKLIEILLQMGAKIEIDGRKKTLTVKKGSPLQGIKIDVNDFIDAITILAVLGCYASGETEIVNGSIARKKESDRIHCIALELKKMGAEIEEKPDGLIIKTSQLRGAYVKSHKDHRIAMSVAIAALGAIGDTVIEDVECVSKTYQNFAKDFQEIGSYMQEITTNQAATDGK
jgi:3-phosphoshikimate 1-carboxyvinyltransferase